MPFLIDTNIAIGLRDGHSAVLDKVASQSSVPQISILTRVELEGGVGRESSLEPTRRVRLDALLARLIVHGFDDDCAAAYGRIIAAVGWSRPRIFDRMIAATALVHNLTLVTMNGADFRDIPGLALEVWPPPGE